MLKVKNILFDLGGVIVGMEPQRTVDVFNELGMPEIAALINPYHPAAMLGELEHGDITFHEMCDKMREVTKRYDVTDEEIGNAYNSFLTGVEVWKLREIDSLRQRGFKVYALSNNNPMSMCVERKMFEVDGKKMEDYFDGMYLSYELHLLKPDKEIYRRTIELSGIRPEETLFLDDSLTNVNVARELGFSVYMPEPKEDFSHLLQSLQLLD